LRDLPLMIALLSLTQKKYMNSRLIKPLLLKLIDLSGFNYSDFDVRHLDISEQVFYDEGHIEDLLNTLNEVGSKVRLLFLKNFISKDKLTATVKKLDFPILVFNNSPTGIQPIIYHQNKSDYIDCYCHQKDSPGQFEAINSTPQEELITNEEGEIIFFSMFSFDSLVSKDDRDEIVEDLTPLKRLTKLFSIERKDIGYIYIYATIIGIVSLSLPLGIQAIVGLISSGMLFQTVVLLITFVLIGILVTGGLQIMQLTIVEILQRRIFTKAAFEFAFRVPRLKLESILHHHAPELMNRFFDILTLQKGLPKVLIDLSSGALQILFGLILLAFYHPFFVFFGLFLLAILVLIFKYTGPKGLKSSIVESKYKYKVVYWLEELARTLNSFKLAGNTYLPIKKTDENVNNYLKNRKIHFRVLVSQLSYIIVFKTLVTGGLLIIGSLLVIDRQITLGQFVASEIIIILILSSVEKIITYMDVIYDMLTAVDKIGHVTDLPLEKTGGVRLTENGHFKNGYSIRTKGLKYYYEEQEAHALHGIDLEIKSGERIGIAGYSGAGKTTLLNVVAGLFTNYQGIATINNVSIKDLDLVNLRHNIAKTIAADEIFDGSIYENISVGMNHVTLERVNYALEKVGLHDFINELPNGIHTHLTSGGKNFSSSVIYKIILARCIAKDPKLLILNDYFNSFHSKEKKKIIDFLVSKENNWTLLVVSNDPSILSECDRVILLKDGSQLNSGPYQDLFVQGQYKEILYTNGH